MYMGIMQCKMADAQIKDEHMGEVLDESDDLYESDMYIASI
jgi:hypothetical protein